LPMDVTPERDAVRRISACYCAPSRSHPVNGSLLHAPAHLSPGNEGEGVLPFHISRFTYFPIIDFELIRVYLRSLAVSAGS